VCVVRRTRKFIRIWFRRDAKEAKEKPKKSTFCSKNGDVIEFTRERYSSKTPARRGKKGKQFSPESLLQGFLHCLV
jgi:hypothetical protein